MPSAHRHTASQFGTAHELLCVWGGAEITAPPKAIERGGPLFHKLCANGRICKYVCHFSRRPFANTATLYQTPVKCPKVRQLNRGISGGIACLYVQPKSFYASQLTSNFRVARTVVFSWRLHCHVMQGVWQCKHV